MGSTRLRSATNVSTGFPSLQISSVTNTPPTAADDVSNPADEESFGHEDTDSADGRV